MKLQQPFPGYFPITQHFAENLNNFYAAEGLKGHEGEDFGLPMGTSIFSACNGKVIHKSTDINRGEGLYVLSSDLFQYNGQDCYLITIYWHMMDGHISVNVGDTVAAGQLLGLSNNTGKSTGAHLHFGVIPVATDGSTRHLAVGNGYADCVDPLPYLNLVAKPTAPPRTLRIGMEGEDVKELQIKLGITADGIFGAITQKYVRDFQEKHGLFPDGIVGPLTRAKLNL